MHDQLNIGFKTKKPESPQINDVARKQKIL